MLISKHLQQVQSMGFRTPRLHIAFTRMPNLLAMRLAKLIIKRFERHRRLYLDGFECAANARYTLLRGRHQNVYPIRMCTVYIHVDVLLGTY